MAWSVKMTKGRSGSCSGVDKESSTREEEEWASAGSYAALYGAQIPGNQELLKSFKTNDMIRFTFYNINQAAMWKCQEQK